VARLRKTEASEIAAIPGISLKAAEQMLEWLRER
jgi:hypothetical protein